MFYALQFLESLQTRPQLKVVSTTLNTVTASTDSPNTRCSALRIVAVPRMWGYMATYQASGISVPFASARATSQYS